MGWHLLPSSGCMGAGTRCPPLSKQEGAVQSSVSLSPCSSLSFPPPDCIHHATPVPVAWWPRASIHNCHENLIPHGYSDGDRDPQRGTSSHSETKCPLPACSNWPSLFHPPSRSRCSESFLGRAWQAGTAIILPLTPPHHRTPGSVP